MSLPERKISEKILKEWESIEDEVLIREVATKGKYINLLISFLAKRNDKSIAETRYYFNAETDKYVYRLLANRQVHKAELVLKNVARDAQIIFYEFVQNSSKDVVDEDIKEYVLEHLLKSNENFEADRDEYDFYLLVLKLIAANKNLRRQFEQELQPYTLEALFLTGSDFRKLVAVTTCLHCKNVVLVEKLDKMVTWRYLLETEQFHYIAKWLDLCYANKKVGSPEIKYNKKELCFDIAIKNLFLSWDIDEAMFDLVRELQLEDRLKNFVLNSFAENGFIIEREREQLLKIFERIFTTESFKHNEQWLMTEPNLLKIIHIILERDELSLLMEKVFTAGLLASASEDYPRVANEIELCIALKSASFTDQKKLSAISTKVSEYILKTSDPDFYTKLPFIYLCEQILRNTDLDELIYSNQAEEILSKIPFIDVFFHKLKTTKTLNDYSVNVVDLLKVKNINLNLIQSEAHPPNADVSSKELLTFSNKVLCQKYAQPTTLNYINYIKQHRSAYAVYQFFLDQVRNYSHVTKPQIQAACGLVSELAVNNLDDKELITHCVAFIEMLGVHTTNLRAYIKSLRIIKESCEEELSIYVIPEKEILVLNEKILLKQMDSNERMFNPHHLEALKILYRSKYSDLPISFLKKVAANSDWFRFLLFAAYHNYSIRSIINVCQMDCFVNRNIGLNIGRALKEIIVEDEMPTAKRTASFSYREHKKKIQNKIETTYLLNANNKAMSTSMNFPEHLSATKLNSSQYLNINDDLDLFAIILICTCEMRLMHEPALNIKLLKELLRNPNAHQPATYLNLIRYSFKMKWPLLTILAATVNDSERDYCWAAWLITSMGLTTIEDVNSLEMLAQTLITYAVQENYVRTLHQSIEIFYAESKFMLFTKFFATTSRYLFTPDITQLLENYLEELQQDAVSIGCLKDFSKTDLLNFSVGLLVEYVKKSFDSMEHSQLLLETICASGISDYTDAIDFCTIASINKILCFTSVRLNIACMLRSQVERNDDEMSTSTSDVCVKTEYARVCEELLAKREFKSAMDFAELLSLSKENIVYENWIYSFETNPKFDIDLCEFEMDQHSLPPIVLINFLIFVSDKIDYRDPKKYAVLKKILEIIKKHHLRPNGNFQRDAIECEMIKSILKNSENIKELNVFNSKYFETVMAEERCVLYKSFMDLKELSGVDDLIIFHTTALTDEETARLEQLMNKLLDQGDIVQALRLQAMFNYRTLDLHYLVFSMALAEGLATLYDLSTDQKQMLNESLKTAASKFNRRTLRLKRHSSCSTSSSPPSKNDIDALDNTRVDFEEAPSGEKQDLLDAIQSLAARVNHGFQIAQRIAMTFRSAMYLEKEYLDVLRTKDPYLLLHNAINEECANRLLVMSDIMTSMQMTSVEIADFMAEQISRSIIKSRFYLLQNSMTNSFGENTLWGYNLDKQFHLFLELCSSTSILGTFLLKYCDALKVYRKFDVVKNTEPDLGMRQNIEELREIFNNLRLIMENQVLSHKKQNTISVELLIKAHDCFVHECSMEGIAYVLQRCKTMTSTLAAAKSWHLIVKLLMGVGRYRDMYYCFETLIKNDQFESMLGQFDEERANGLKEAIVQYLHDNYPEDKENYRLAALHFQMFKELAQMSEIESKTMIEKMLVEKEIKCDDLMTISSTTNLSRFSSDNADFNGIISTSDGLTNGSSANVIGVPVSLLKCNMQLIDLLSTAMDGYAHAAENYLLDNKLGLAQRAAYSAELVALQINLVRVAIQENNPNCFCVLNIRAENVFRYLVNTELSVPQALILSRTYPYEIVWTEAIFNQYIIQGKDSYFVDYCSRIELSDDMIEIIVNNFLQMSTTISNKMEQSISAIVEKVQSVTMRYKLASLLSDKRIIANLINEESLYYLKDTNYGRNEQN